MRRMGGGGRRITRPERRWQCVRAYSIPAAMAWALAITVSQGSSAKFIYFDF